MAHQAHNIPWSSFAAQLKWSSKYHPGSGDLHFRDKPNQGKVVRHFVESFVQNLLEHSRTTRLKYPPNYKVPLEDDLILDDETVRKISPTICRIRSDIGRRSHFHETAWEHGSTDDNDLLPRKERLASAFLRQYRQNPCYEFLIYNGDAYFNLTIVETLILYGEMDAVFRVTSHPDIGLSKWREVSQCYDTVRRTRILACHVRLQFSVTAC